jgi:SAM-dependent methyltransferase
VIAELPLPPEKMRELVGLVDPGGYDNPTGDPIWPGLPASAWRSYLDFGSGCGRSARRLLQQREPPARYIGLDLHAGMVRWCNEHLTPPGSGFSFVHHDVFNPGLNPDRRRPWALPLPVEAASCSLIEATSVFTHLTESQAEHYLDEIERVLTPDGVLIATFFLFDKPDFPMLQNFQNALYVNENDPTNAVIFARTWLRDALRHRGLLISGVGAPEVRGFHWTLRVCRAGAGAVAVEFPEDSGRVARRPPPLLRAGGDRIGLEPGVGEQAVAPVQRAELPSPDPVAAELAGAKEYIASLEEHLGRAQAELERRSAV